jgi:hypothetical protein
VDVTAALSRERRDVLRSCRGERKPLRPEERQLIPVSPLKFNQSADHAKEAATTQSLRIAPLQDGPLAVLEKVLGDTVHLGGIVTSCQFDAIILSSSASLLVGGGWNLRAGGRNERCLEDEQYGQFA